MATILFRILSLYNLLNALFLALIPKKLRSFLPQSWYPQQHHQQPPHPRISTSHRRAESEDLHRIFEMFDHNRDGRITKDELRDSLESIGIFVTTPDLNRMVEEIDVDGDGCIDMYEFKKLYRSMIAEEDGGTGTGKDDEDDELVKEAFDVFDQNGDGFITVDELWSVMASLGMKQVRAVDDCRKMIGKIDADGDGRVNFLEFKRMLKGGRFSQ